MPTPCVRKLHVDHGQVRRGGVGEEWYRFRRRPKFNRALLLEASSISKLAGLACSFLIPLALLCLLELMSLEEVAAMLGRPCCRGWLMVTPLALLCLLELVLSLAEVVAMMGRPSFTFTSEFLAHN
jgi:hypothetical protein